MQKELLLWLADVFMISVVDLLSAGSSFAEERVCEELVRLLGSPRGGGSRVAGGIWGRRGLIRVRTGLAMSELGGGRKPLSQTSCCWNRMVGWDGKLLPDLSLPWAGAFPRGWGEPWAGALRVHQPPGFPL